MSAWHKTAGHRSVGKFQRSIGGLSKSVESFEDEESPFATRGNLLRTKRLLLAALRVWELKNGFNTNP